MFDQYEEWYYVGWLAGINELDRVPPVGPGNRQRAMADGYHDYTNQTAERWDIACDAIPLSIGELSGISY